MIDDTLSADPVEVLEQAASRVRDRMEGRRPVVAIVLGSGLGFLHARVSDPIRISFRDIPGFPLPSVDGHRGELIIGEIAGREVLLQSGRFHMYEGHSPEVCALPVRVFSRVGIDVLLLTNAAGGVRRTFGPGTLMLVADHVNLSFRNPLTGPVFPGEERFPDMSEPYDRELRAVARQVAAERGVGLEEGVYAGLLGPAYETPAEVRLLDRMGVDAVGMSTVIEVIVARARGMRCLGISTITNPASGISAIRLSHEAVMRAAEAVKEELAAIVDGTVSRL